eukprot:GHVR01172313.1.p1 GENE.GHVR01172313.1~~GHVR01172313.1.p1  ORF type:complete len:165 (-),score=96.30 GHVR01172313.1:11-505(-)
MNCFHLSKILLYNIYIHQPMNMTAVDMYTSLTPHTHTYIHTHTHPNSNKEFYPQNETQVTTHTHTHTQAPTHTQQTLQPYTDMIPADTGTHTHTHTNTHINTNKRSKSYVRNRTNPTTGAQVIVSFTAADLCADNTHAQSHTHTDTDIQLDNNTEKRNILEYKI